MEALNRKLLKTLEAREGMVIGSKDNYPEKVLQFGEGNFLRGFVDWMFHRMNLQGLFNGHVVVAQPIREGLVNLVNQQDGLYSLFLRGVQDGRVENNAEVVTSISRGINLYEDFQAYLDIAESPDLRVVVSNTTEAGICYNPHDKLTDTPPASYPGKLTVLLYKRYQKYKGDPSKGLIIIPCELIDRNGDNLKAIILRLARGWQLEEDFTQWLNSANYFLNTLVDRIVTGYPRDEIGTLTEKLGYEDKLLNTGEIFHLWVIEGDKDLARELPFTQAGLNVIWTDDMTPYRSRKVRILNGAHTMSVLAAYLYGLETVKDCMDDPLILSYIRKGIFSEIIPTLDLPEAELNKFARDVLERFSNPFIKHYLLSISLNSVSKFKARVLPSLLTYQERKGQLPEVLSFSLAALFAFYRGTDIRDGALIGMSNGKEYRICDDMPILEHFRDAWLGCNSVKIGLFALVSELFAQEAWWGMNLNQVEGLCEKVTGYLESIIHDGCEKTIRKLCGSV